MSLRPAAGAVELNLCQRFICRLCMHASVITFTSQVGGSHQLELIPFHRDGVHVKK